jgi:ABC-type multidrug transport system fused ATPase/permease subunit
LDTNSCGFLKLYYGSWENMIEVASTFTVLKRASNLLSKRDKKKVGIVVVLQVFMGGIDLLAIALISILGSLAVSGISSQQPGSRVYSILEFLHLSETPFQRQAAILAISATLLMILRTVVSVIFTRKIMFFLSRRGAAISSDLVRKLLSQTLLFIQGRTSQQTLYALTHGVTSITLGILGTTVAVVSDLSLLLILTAGVFVVDPMIAFGMTVVFGLIGYALYKLMHKRAKILGQHQAEYEIASNEKIIEVLGSYREAIVRNRRGYYAGEIGELRHKLADTQAELTFMPSISKYVIESTVILGALAISAIQFVLQDASHAVATLAVLIATGSRIAPAALRLQQGAVQLRSTIGVATPTLDLIESLKNIRIPDNDETVSNFNHAGFAPNVEVNGISITYPNRENPAVSDVSLKVAPGEIIAIVGSSGAGKTTLVDSILGVLNPEVGSVKISGKHPLAAVAEWPGAVSYVPQDVLIVNGTFRQNIALGFPEILATDARIAEAIEIAQLTDLIESLPNGVDTFVGERGARLSGGQRQRLGIARAMFTSPKLLVLDEATSALDGQTEALISESILNLAGDVTVLVIAHRLSTIKSVDRIAYMSEGKIVCVGDFETVRKQVPDFNNQAKLMGL